MSTFLAWLLCYGVASQANCQTGMTIPTTTVVFRSVNQILHLPFFWLPPSVYRTNAISGAGVYQTWYFVLVACFWGFFVYMAFPSIRNRVVSGIQKKRGRQAGTLSS